MSEDYAAIAAEVSAGLIEAGTTATITRQGAPTGPVHNPVAGVPTDHPVKVVYESWRSNQIDGTLIQAGDRKVLVGADGLGITPEPGDVFTDHAGREYSVVAPTESTAPAGVAVLHTINIRG